MQAGLYRHYKGGYYQVLGVAEHSETHERLVIYISLDHTKPGPRMRARPVSGAGGWDTPVVLSDGPTIQRFKYVGNELLAANQGS